MVLECVRVRSLPANARESHIEADWSDLNIAQKGVLHISNRFYVFFNNAEDAEDGKNRGFRHDHKDYKAKRLSIPDAISELRPLLMAERRKAESLGDKFQYPDIFEINNIKVKWEDRKFSDPDLVVSPPSLKKMKKSEPESPKQDSHFRNIKISVSKESNSRRTQETSLDDDQERSNDEESLEKSGSYDGASDSDNGKKSKKSKKKKKNKDKDREKSEKKAKKEKKKKKNKDRDEERGRSRSVSKKHKRSRSRNKSSRHRDSSRDPDRSSRKKSLSPSRELSSDRDRHSRKRSVSRNGDRSRERDRRSRKKSLSPYRLSKRKIGRSRSRSGQRSNSRSRRSETRKSNRSRSPVARRRSSPPIEDDGEYNPLAMLKSNLGRNDKAKSPDRARDRDRSRDRARKRSRSKTPPRNVDATSKSSEKGIDLRSRLSRTNKRAEERQKRFGNVENKNSNDNSQPWKNEQPWKNNQPWLNKQQQGRGYNQGSRNQQMGFQNQQHHNTMPMRNKPNKQEEKMANQMMQMQMMMQMQSMMMMMKSAQEMSQQTGVPQETPVQETPVQETAKESEETSKAPEEISQTDTKEQNMDTEESNHENMKEQQKELGGETSESKEEKTDEEKAEASTAAPAPVESAPRAPVPGVDGSLDDYMNAQQQQQMMEQMMAMQASGVAMDPQSMMMAMMNGGMAGMNGMQMGNQDMSMAGPSMEEQIAVAKPMLQNLDTTDKKFIDTHCHIDVMFKKESYDGDWDTYRDNVAIQFPNSYEGCITSFCDPKLFMRKFAFDVLKSESVHCCFGVHPHYATLYGAEVEAQLELLIGHPKCVAWGAVGLDYTDKYGRTDHGLQQAVFKRQCELAVKYKKPLVVQCRRAESDLSRILKEVVPREHKIHRHCLNDRLETVKDLMEYFPNMYIGFTNVITNNRAQDARDAAAACPLERMLLETDAPHFVPRTLRHQTFGGTTPVSMSHPGMALCVALEIAQMQGRTLDEVLEKTRENCRNMYGV